MTVPSRIRVALALALLVAVGAVTGCRSNPVSGQIEFNIVGVEQELAMGDAYHPSIVMGYDGELLDADLKRYLGTIVMRLHRLSHRPGIPMDFTVVNTSMINAFAIPGHVYATRGFLAKLENEAQFASVMGHEIAHVTAGHAARKMSRQLAALLGLALVASAAGEGSGAGIMQAGQVGFQFVWAAYSRGEEHQADRVGTYYMALGGWDPRQSIRMQQILGALGGHRTQSTLDKYLATHPPMNERIRDIEAVIVEKNLSGNGWRQGDGVFAGRWQRRLAEVRAIDAAFDPYDEGMKALSQEKPDHAAALAAADRAIQGRPDQAPFWRLRGDALLAQENARMARFAYENALRIDPRYVPANFGLGRIALDADDLPEAERQFARAAHGFPDHVLAHYGLGVARVRQEKFAEAIAPLETTARAAPNEPQVWFLLAVCYEHEKRQAEALAAYERALAVGLEGDEAAHARKRVGVLSPLVRPPQPRAAR